MPNGHDRSWVRLCAAVDGFRHRYGRWPTRIRVFPASLGFLRDLFTDEDFAAITAKVELVPDEAGSMVAEDEDGASYNYGREGFLGARPSPCAAEWFDVTPKPHD
jgi:hypothetical protein